MIEMLEGRFFKTFVTVLQERSFSRAADKLGYVQSTVTAHIRLLEQACGKKLFNRLARGVEPTEAGEEMAKFAHQFVHLGASLEEAMNRLDDPRGTVRLQALESFCVTRLPRFFGMFFTRYPHIKLHLETGFFREVLDGVANHRADLGIVSQHPHRDDLDFYPLQEERLLVVASPDIVRVYEQEGWEGLREARVIGFGSRCVYQTCADELLSAQGLKGNDVLEFASLEMIKQTVRSGLGIALLPEIGVKAEVEAGGLGILPTEPVLLTHGLVARSGRELTSASGRLRDSLTGYFGGSGEG
ncbi:LysR family transcriptional regulator [Paenibacillus hemerocallicola]|uniref:LysR family transcriptional regulator n=1 Tax=Paenibacillus hemerocallicola TaxID=1172614 RepID=A0A5C4SZK1_9BACL|nr:LysR family transcriptional regulator [Paenibacillus hemerocallicola]TNJ62278.1 LysR family transcriptional regulator [Paenibacillus hemerocallicola]